MKKQAATAAIEMTYNAINWLFVMVKKQRTCYVLYVK